MPMFGFDQNPPAANAAFGFPDHIRGAFLKTANATKCVIMSRVPGKAASMLIDERYDLKGYFVKAKSCDWGPMAGFICATPQFSKIEITIKTVGEQTKALRDYLGVLWDMRRPNQEKPGELNNPRVHPPGDRTNKELTPMRHRAFVPVEISNARKDWLVNHAPECIDQDLYDRDTGVGIAHNGKVTVVMPYLFKEIPNNRWQVFHGGAWVKEGQTWVRTPTPDLLDFPPDLRAPLILPNQLERFESTFNRRFGGKWPFSRNDSIALAPVYACQNPWPAYDPDLPDIAYRNAFAGDYDLFAVWPTNQRLGLQRTSEFRWQPAGNLNEVKPDARSLTAGARVFRPVSRKVFTVESSRVDGLYIEFVPLKYEMKTLEDDEMGNINQVVMDACVYLNSFTAAAYADRERTDKWSSPPNVAFHSDEGGRLFIEAIEYPVAVFLPDQLARDMGFRPGDPRDFVIDKGTTANRNFARMLAALNGWCETSISAAWLYDLLTEKGADGKPRKEGNQYVPSALAPAIVNYLLSGRYTDQPPAVSLDLIQTIIQRVGPLPEPETDEDHPAPQIPEFTASETYARVNLFLNITVPLPQPAQA